MEPGEFVELRRVGARLRDLGHEVVVLFARSDYGFLHRDGAVCAAEGFSWVDARGRMRAYDDLDPSGYRPPSLTAEPPTGKRLLLLAGTLLLALLAPLLFVLALLASWVRRPFRGRRLRASLLGELNAMLKSVVSYGLLIRRYRRLVGRVRPAVILIGQDYAGSQASVLVRQGHRTGVPTVLIPYALGTARELAESLHPASAYHVSTSYLSKLLVRLQPAWLHRYQGDRLVRLPGSYGLAVEFWGLTPPHPWIPNSGGADWVAVESQEMLDYYRDMKFPQERLVLTGSMTDDVLADGILSAADQRAALEERLDLEPGRPLVVCAWPPNQLGSRAPFSDFREYDKLCEFWARTLAKVRDDFGYNVVVRLHPVLRPGDVEALAEEEIPVSRWDTARLVPLCDIFVASVSSTIRWAVAAGKPVVNYDVFRYGYSDFSEEDGVLTMVDGEDFVRSLRDLAGQPPFHAELTARQAQRRERWGQLDHSSGDRILALIERAVAEGHVAAR